MENLYFILAISGAAVMLLATVVTLICKLIKALKNGDFETAKNLLTEGVIAAVKFAEQLRSRTGTPLSGADKKAVALNEVKAFCATNGIAYIEESVSEMIENIISLTKTVNAKSATTTSESAGSIAGAQIG